MNKLIIALIAGGLAVGCGSKKEDTTVSKAQAEKMASKLAESVQGVSADSKKKVPKYKAMAEKAKAMSAMGKGLKKGGPPLTLEKYESLMLALKNCEVQERGIDTTCPEWVSFDGARKNRRDMMRNLGGGLAKLGQKHINHPSAAVRLQAASLMSSLFGASKASQSALLTAAKTEKHPRVLKTLMRAVGSSIAKNEKVQALMLANAGHADEGVRREVLTSITSSWARGTEGTLEKAMEMAQNDPSASVRKYACRRLGARANDKVLPLLTKLTADSKADPKMYAACMQGLIAMWSSPVVHEVPSEKAYALTLKRLKATPRTKDQPPWAAMSNMSWAKRPKFQQRAKWFKMDVLLSTLSAIVLDRNTNWMARTGAIDTMKKLGAAPALFIKLKAAYAESGKSGRDKHVHAKLVKALADKKK